MTIKVGDKLPNATIREFIEVEGNGCSIGPNAFQVADLVKGKRIVIFGLPGAYTPTCSVQHVPGYVKHYDALKAKGVDEIWCVSVNDAFVMGAWGRDELTRALGLELDLTRGGLGIRSQRYAMLVDDGVVKSLDVEAAGKFEVSGAEPMLARL